MLKQLSALVGFEPPVFGLSVQHDVKLVHTTCVYIYIDISIYIIYKVIICLTFGLLDRQTDGWSCKSITLSVGELVIKILT